MGNMMDYLAWRGDLDFYQSEFNEVDNLILAELVYVDFSGIVPGLKSNYSISLAEASRKFFLTHTEEEIEKKVSSTKMAAFLMRKMAETKRFSDAELFYYVDDISEEEESQFSVVTIRLGDGSIYISFSGTDSSIVGWKENFNMSFLSETPGQLKAVEYLNKVFCPSWKNIRIGGHSKGGNLSVYAAVYCKEYIQNNIGAIYSNDGPGFTRNVTEKEAYRRMLPKIHTIIPRYSIVGMLLEHEGECSIVESSKTGAMQHDAMTWNVERNSLVHVDSVAEESIFLNQTLKSWIGKMDITQREEFVETLFLLLDSAKIETVDDLAGMKWKTVLEFIMWKNPLGKESTEALTKALRMLWEEGNRTYKIMKKRKRIPEILQK